MRVHSSRSCTFLKQLEAISQTSLPLSDEIVQATAFCVYNCSPLHFQLQKCSAHSLEASLVFAASCCKIVNISQVMQEQRKGLKCGSNIGLLFSIHVKQQSTTTGLSGESICAMSLALPKLLADSNSSAAASGLAALMSPDASL